MYSLDLIRDILVGHENTPRITPAPNCITDFLDLPDDTGQSGLTLELFPMVILVNQVWRHNCFHWIQL